MLAPLAVIPLVVYPYAKRFTDFPHACWRWPRRSAPVGAWLAITGTFAGSGPAWLLGAAVGLWIGGFDLIYACQDAEVDREIGVRSCRPATGAASRCTPRRSTHVVTFALFVWFGAAGRLRLAWWIGLALTAVAFVYQHIVVTPNDLSRVNRAFFTANGFVGIALFVFAVLDLSCCRSVSDAACRGSSVSPGRPARRTRGRCSAALLDAGERGGPGGLPGRAADAARRDRGDACGTRAGRTTSAPGWAVTSGRDLAYWSPGDLAAGPAVGRTRRGDGGVPASTAAWRHRAGAVQGPAAAGRRGEPQGAAAAGGRAAGDAADPQHLVHLVALHDAGAVVLPASPASTAPGPSDGAAAGRLRGGESAGPLGVPHDLFPRWRGELDIAQRSPLGGP